VQERQDRAVISRAPQSGDLDREVAANPLWYHTMQIGPGVVTPGWFDLRPIVDQLPWPELEGKRCLDIGTYDGFLAFEMERRGASEVVATDVPEHEDWDWPSRLRARGPEALAAIAGPKKGLGFEIARRALDSSVQRELISAYELTPERMGSFDVVVCGSLMLHLRDPLRALEAIRSVCSGSFLSNEEIRIGLSGGRRGRPVAELDGTSDLCQWWVPSAAGHRQMLLASGFDIERATRPSCIPLGPSHPPRSRSPRQLRRRLAVRVATGSAGVPCQALLARPAV
jgi:tRNA (mo5U34)-methyltransferase